MSDNISSTSKWMYRGFWGVLSRWFMVPEQAPDLPVTSSEQLSSFKPDIGWLNYCKLQFWIGLFISNILIVAVCLVLIAAYPVIGMIVTPLVLLMSIFKGGIDFLALYLKYDTTWYVLSDKSLRIRRGIWFINEMTVSFDNIQNVSIKQGPLQRYFNISDLYIETAGGSSNTDDGTGLQAHKAIIEGISYADSIRQMILQKLKNSSGAGLGDEMPVIQSHGWKAEHIEVLRDIKGLLN